MNIVFLDVDGVLNCDAYFKSIKGTGILSEIDKNTLPLLKKIVEENDAEIVLSSTWRDLEYADDPYALEMWQLLIDSLASFGLSLYDKTPILCKPRPEEIKAWLEAHPEVKAWISIEDDCSEEDYSACGIGGHLVQTHFWGKKENCGLQECYVKMAKEMFEKQLVK